MQTYSKKVTDKRYGMAALIQHNGLIHTHAIGVAGDSLVMTPDKVFNIASLTKTFTAVLILQEIEKGTLKLNDTIGKWFTANKNVATGITIEQLLRQTSGLEEVVEVMYAEKVFLDAGNDYNHVFLYDKIGAPIAKPGEGYKYRNTNYIMLGYILEALNQKPYNTIIKERIFDVCNMKNSYAYYSKNISNAAHPMMGKDLLSAVNDTYYKNYSFSAACIASNLFDLSSFFNLLYTTNSLISRKSFSNMATFNDSDYGMGLQRYPYKNTYFYGHGGDNISFKIRNYYNPVTNDLLIIASNRFGDPYMDKLTKDVLEVYGF